MKKLLFSFLFLCSCVLFSCSSETEQERAAQCAIAFCESFYNFNYPAATEYVTSSSLPLIRYYASNVQEEYLSAVRQTGGATVSWVHTETDEQEQYAEVVCLIKNFIEPDFANRKYTVVSERQDTLNLEHTEGKWRVRRDIPQQSEK